MSKNRTIKTIVIVAGIFVTSIACLVPIEHSNGSQISSLGPSFNPTTSKKKSNLITEGVNCLGISPSEGLTLGIPFYTATGRDPMCGHLTINKIYPVAVVMNTLVVATVFYVIYRAVKIKDEGRI